MAHRRGRRSHDEYVEAVIALLRADIWTLKDQKAFAEYPGVKALVAQFTGEAWPLGIALHVLIASAVADVYRVASSTPTRASARVAEFLRRWYYEQQTVSATATVLHLSRSHVAKTIQRPAQVFVAQRFLELARLVQPESQSEELRQVLSTFGQRQAAIAERPGAKLVMVRAGCLDASA